MQTLIQPTPVPNETIQDIVAALLVAGTNVTLTYNDAANTLTIAATSAGPNDEYIQDLMATTIVDSPHINWTYQDALNQLSCDIFGSSIGTPELTNDGVTYAKIQNVTDNKLLGRSSGSDGDIQEITIGTGLSLSSGALAATGDGSYTDEQAQDAVGVILTDSATVDLTYNDTMPSITADIIAGSVGTTQLANDSVTYAKIQNVTANRILGRFPGSSGDVQECTVGDGLDLALGILGIVNDGVTFARIQNITDNRVLGRSAGSNGDVQEIQIGTGLALASGSLIATVDTSRGVHFLFMGA